MEGLKSSVPSNLEKMEENPILTFEPLTEVEINEVFELINEIITGNRLKNGSHGNVVNKNKFTDEKVLIAEMGDDEFADFIRNCKRGSENLKILIDKPHVATLVLERLVKTLHKLTP